MTLDLLRGHAFLAGMPDGHLQTLAALAEEVCFQEDEVILRAGERSAHFYLLLSGSVCVEANARAVAVRVQALSAGEAFGWSALLDHHDTLFQVRARERSTALRLERQRLAAACRADPVLGAELLRRTLRLVAGRVQATEARLGELCGMRMPRQS